VQLQASTDMSRRYFEASIQRGNAVENPAAMKNYLSLELRLYAREVFAMFSLDTRHRAISFDKLFFGTLNSTNVYPREIVKKALKHNAAAVVFAHNQPSGIAEPSIQDKNITKRLKSALSLVDIKVLDHIVVGDGETVSLAERGLR
jgi:DNA repair protein RadC